MPRKIGERRGRVKKMSLPKKPTNRFIEITSEKLKELLDSQLHALSMINDDEFIALISLKGPLVMEIRNDNNSDYTTKGGTSIKLNGKELQ